MAALRKLWSTTIMAEPGRKSHESKAAVYRYFRNDLRRRKATENAIVDVWVDERGGAGWELYERVNLADYDAWEEVQ